MSEAKEWAQLVCTSDFDSRPVPICGKKFTIGRAPGCNFSLPENKLISGQHCVLTRNDNGSVVLKDTSTNGTLIKSSVGKVKVTNGKVHSLHHGDEVFLVFKKEDHSNNVAYLFQDRSQLLDETLINEDQESDGEDCTQEYELQKQESDTRPAGTATKRPVRETDHRAVGAPQAKRPRAGISEETPADQSCEPQHHTNASPPGVEIATSDSLAAVDSPVGANLHGVSTTTSASASSVVSTRAVDHGGITTAKTTSDVAVDSPKGENLSCITLTNSTSAAADGSPQAANPTGVGTATTISGVGATDPSLTPSTGNADVADGDGIEDNLTCSICQDIFHDCISLQPCLHSFCAACYSSWMNVSRECPSCRNDVVRVSRNFIVNSLVEAFLKDHPDKKRSEEEIADMDSKNKISRDMMTLPKKPLSQWDSTSDDDESDDDDYNDTGFCLNSCRAPPRFGQPFSRSGIQFGPGQQIGPFMVHHPTSVCMQCPAYTGPGPDAGITWSTHRPAASADPNSTAASQPPASTSTSTQSKASTSAHQDITDRPSTSSNSSTGSINPVAPSNGNCRGYKLAGSSEAIPMPVVPQYACPEGGTHLMCGCCHRQMPDRRQAYYANPQSVPSQKCDVCGNFFCHQYWGCNKLDCNGCLNKFQDLHFGKKSLDKIILKNSYESEIFKDYLKRRNLTWKDVLQSSLAKLDFGEYICQDGAINRITSANMLCYHCGLKNFQELAYQYRRDIPRDDLPLQIATRPDCHWGKKCRTQINKLHHAKNFNHVCEQTRF